MLIFLTVANTPHFKQASMSMEKKQHMKMGWLIHTCSMVQNTHFLMYGMTRHGSRFHVVRHETVDVTWPFSRDPHPNHPHRTAFVLTSVEAHSK